MVQQSAFKGIQLSSPPESGCHIQEIKQTNLMSEIFIIKSRRTVFKKIASYTSAPIYQTDHQIPQYDEQKKGVYNQVSNP